ncbi:MAG: hypothetical protein JNM25_04785 [Planctomycetes bacterium]|nr:hypothetical protein [Planctomycetota bacterium]
MTTIPTPGRRTDETGIALLAVLFALMLLALLALPFAVSMSVGAEAASREFHQAAVEQASASVRDLLLADAALSEPTFDPTPQFDGRDEWPDHVELPKPFEPLQEEGRVLLGGEVWDQQRFFSLDGVSPLVLANLLGTATRLREDLLPEASAIVVEDTQNLPESGYVWLAGELIRYGSKDGGSLLDLSRGLLQEFGYATGKEPVSASALVLDQRCVVAAAWPFTHRGNGATRRPFTTVGELAEIARGEMGAFTADELDTLDASMSANTLAATAATWGRPERVFDDLLAGKSKSLRVKSALHLGAGSTIRLTNTRTQAVEYALVMAAETERATKDLLFPVFRLDLLLPVAQDHPAIDTVVEPLIPAPVNVNTASVEVLTALCRELRRSASVQVHEADGRERPAPPPSLSAGQARDLAEEIVSRRGGDGGPFTGWQDLVDRVLKPRLDAATSSLQKQLWLMLYRNFETGRDSQLEMGTAPICFVSGPWVGYRAAASRARSVVAPGVVGRHERTGIAVAVPGFQLEHVWNTQQHFEESFRLDRRAPFWTTTPINLGALQTRLGDSNDPAPRSFPHLVPVAYPGLGLGAPRYASSDPADASLQPARATAVSRPWVKGQIQAVETFAQGTDPRGHDVTKAGSYLMQNTGPSSAGGSAASSGGRHDKISFPFANPDSFVGRWATSFWAEPQTLEGTTLFDHSDGDPDRNRIAVHGRDGNLVVEVIDEAGLDPDPSQSPAGVERTAAQWTLPLAELGLPADTPLHLSVSAYGNRADDLSVAVDGIVRGKPKFRTYLTASLPVFDPNLGNNSDNPPGQPGSERYVDLQVESTEGFPPVGVLRIGTELFEYTGINGNSFQCRWQDSMGGRGVRMIGREFRPDIPVDGNGEPTIDLNDPNLQGVNLDVYPEHPAGSQVELYGYSTLLSDDSPMMVGSTRLSAAVGGFAVARGWLSSNPRPITIATTPPFQIGVGLDETWTGDLELADPVPTGRQDPTAASGSIVDAFPTTGGYALLIQRSLIWQSNFQPGALSSSTRAGGVELVKYTSRQGNKLAGIQRAQTLPGNDNDISRDHYDPGKAQRFVTNFTDWPWDPTDPQTLWDDIPTLILWVVPVSLSVQGSGSLWDPAQTGLTEWVQLYPDGGDATDTEWVRYDVLAERQHIVRANRAAWDQLRYELTRGTQRDTVQVGPLGPQTVLNGAKTPPWGTVTTTAGHIGYVPKLEADFPQIHAARRALGFRGDPFTRTSSHAQSNALVMQCQRLQLNWGNWGAFTGRVGRHDRVALVQGSTASGSARPPVEWHTVNWSARRYNADTLLPQPLKEHLGPWPFQLVAFRDGVQGAFLGPASGTVPAEPRQYDRVVKFPSGELPAAFCENVAVGSGVGNLQPITGCVDEIEVTTHPLADLIVETAFNASANTFQVLPSTTYNAAGADWRQAGLADAYPATGGLVQIDGEILAYQSRADGAFTVATNGRGLLNTEAKDHDRGARVHFLTHRPMAILAGNVGVRAETLPVQAQGALPTTYGTLLLGREVLHYCWVRAPAGQTTLEMPRWYPPGEDPTSTQGRGLFRGRFGSTPQGGSTGEAVIGFPFRYWDRFAEASDDPELAYAQLTTTSAPAFFRTLHWREETRDPRVDVICLVRADGRAPWSAEPATTPDLWRFEQAADSDIVHRIAAQASRLEVRFATVYKPGVLDLVTYRQHGWKTSARVEDVRLDYEGQRRIVDERVTAR